MKLSSSTEWLFFHLWKKSPSNNSSCPGIFIADTIIYRWAQPYFWYYTQNDGQIVRKTKEKIFSENIEAILNRFNQNELKINTTGITTCYMKTQDNGKKINQTDKIEFEYFDNYQFHNFLYQREKSLNSILQKFIIPKDGKNSMIKVSWSPQFCILLRKTNIHQLNNRKIAIDDRLITFEGAENLTDSDSIASKILATDLEHICLNIVKHIQEVSGGNIQISRMVLYFKLDYQNRIWLLFCSGIKIREKFQISEENKNSNTQNKQQRLTSPILSIKQMQITNSNKNLLNFQQIPIGLDICLDCHLESFDAELASEFLAEPKQYEDLIERLGGQLDFLQNEEDSAPSQNQPYLLTKVNGRICDEKYQKLKNNTSWLEMELEVCSECYIKYTQVTLENQEMRAISNIVSKNNQIIQNSISQRPKLIQQIQSNINDQLNSLKKNRQQFLDAYESQINDTIKPIKKKYLNVQSKFLQDDFQNKQNTQMYQFYNELPENQEKLTRKTKTSEVKLRKNYESSNNIQVQHTDKDFQFFQLQKNKNPKYNNNLHYTQTSNSQNTFKKQNKELNLQQLNKFIPDLKYNSTQIQKVLAKNKQRFPGINIHNQSSVCSNSTQTSSKRIEHSIQINIIQDLKHHLKDI